MGKFKTEFKVTGKSKKYLENEGISLACLIPDAWRFYESFLFDSIYGFDQKPKKELGKSFCRNIQ